MPHFKRTTICIILALMANIKECHQVSKRYLLFPEGTLYQMTYGLSVPAILPKRSINLSVCLQNNFELPANSSVWFPTVVRARSQKDGDHDLDRKTFYKYLMAIFDGLGLNGKKCLLRSICEVAQIPMHIEDTNSILERIVHYLLTPSEDTLSLNVVDYCIYERNDSFVDAELFGRSGGGCADAFFECPFSLVDLFTKIFNV